MSSQFPSHSQDSTSRTATSTTNPASSENSYKPLPEWLRRPSASHSETNQIKKILRSSSLNTVCEEARCPNIAECFGRGTATFMILGDICTRGCRFCSVFTGKPLMPSSAFKGEAESLALAVKKMGLKHVVITSVARDDLSDGGASGFVESIKAVRAENPNTTLEVLVPDFRGNPEVAESILAEKPEVFNHNLETIPRLYRRVRPGASYSGSLSLLAMAAKHSPRTLVKSGIMLGLGESQAEVKEVFKDASDSGVSIFTAGQYMQPSRSHLSPEKYLSPNEFNFYRQEALKAGFPHVVIEPLARSSYKAESHLKLALASQQN